MTFQEVASFFSDVKPSFNGYVARCPLCRKKNKLSIGQGRKGVVVNCFHCKARGLQIDSILDCVGLKLSDLFQDAPCKPVEQKPPRKPSATVQPVQRQNEGQPLDWGNAQIRWHVYRSTDGKPLAKKEVTSFPDGSKRALWFLHDSATGRFRKRPGLDGMRVPLWNLHKLAADPTTPVIFCEGEKDCETVSRLAGVFIIPTTCPNGAGQTSWPDEWTNLFHGRSVTILADNDEPGERYAQFIARNLFGIARRIRIVPASAIWPDVQPKGDVSDIAAALGDAEAFERLKQAVRIAKAYAGDTTRSTPDGGASCPADYPETSREGRRETCL